MAVETPALILPTNGDDPRRPLPTEAVAGTAKSLTLIGYQPSGILTGLLNVDAAIVGSDFLWDARYAVNGRQVFFEAFLYGSVLATQTIAALYTLAGAPIAGATVMVTNTTTGLLMRSTASFTIPDATVVQVHLKSAVLGVGALRQARLIIL